MMARRAHGGEAGFAMLVVFLLAAFIGIALYKELPRVVMESQRDREELLIDRGTQYKRAIQVFYRKFSALSNGPGRARQHQQHSVSAAAIQGPHDRRGRVAPDPRRRAGDFHRLPGERSSGNEDGAEREHLHRERGRATDARLDAAAPERQVLAGGVARSSRCLGWRRPSADSLRATPIRRLRGRWCPPCSGPDSGARTVAPADTSGLTQASDRDANGDVDLPGGTVFRDREARPRPFRPPCPRVPRNRERSSRRNSETNRHADRSGHGDAGPGQPESRSHNRDRRWRPADFPAPQSGDADDQPTSHRAEPEGDGGGVPASSGQQPLQVGGIAGVASKLESESIKIYNERSKYNEWEFIYDPRPDRTAQGRADAR